MISGRDMVFVGGDFARHPSSAEHLLRRFLPGNSLIWVETIGMRRPTFSLFDLKRAAEKVARLGKPGSARLHPDLPAGLTVVTPTMWPFHDVGWVKRMNEESLVEATLGEISRRGFKNYGLVTTVPLAAGLGRKIGASFVAYYCMDDWAHWPGLLRDAIPVWEKRLIAEADVVVVTSEELQRTKSGPGKAAHLLPHGVDIAHFARARTPGTGPVRRLTCFGLFDARTDQNVLAAVARMRPEVTLEIIGPVQVDVSALKALPNVRFTGSVPYSALPEALAPADALLLPYRLDLLAKSINPLKIRESLATGKPVIAMALDEVSTMPGLIRAGTPEQFIERCLALIDGKVHAPHEDLSRWLESSSWEARAEDLSGWLAPYFNR